jgi:hypothetical protein
MCITHLGALPCPRSASQTFIDYLTLDSQKCGLKIQMNLICGNAISERLLTCTMRCTRRLSIKYLVHSQRHRLTQAATLRPTNAKWVPLSVFHLVTRMNSPPPVMGGSGEHEYSYTESSHGHPIGRTTSAVVSCYQATAIEG